MNIHLKSLLDQFLKSVLRTQNLLLLLLILFSYFFLDQSIAKFCHTVLPSNRSLFKQASLLISPPMHLILWPIVCMICYLKRGILTYFFMQVSMAQFISAGVIKVLKVVIGRSRPDVFLSQKIFDFSPMNFQHNYHSFPSGHSLTIFTLAFSISYLIPKYKYLFLSLAALLSSSRILLSYHYLSDVLGGALVAMIISHTIHPFLIENKGAILLFFNKKKDRANK